jgi:hypothetical protein
LNVLLFLLSAGLLLETTLLLVRRLARNATEFFWLFPAFLSLQLGVLSGGLSLGGWMTPRWWLTAQATLLVGVFLWSRRGARLEPLDALASFRRWWVSAPLLARGASAIAFLFLALSGVRQVIEPLSGFDDRMYHASRVAYWMQNESLLPYPTHNERQVAFPFGSELYFLWPALMTKSEAAGRVVFWLGYPLAAIGAHLLAGTAGAREPYRSLATLLFVSTPIVGSLSIGLAPESWLTVFELATAFWMLEAAKAADVSEAARASAWASVFFLLALNVKTTAVGLALPVALLPLLIAHRGARWLTFRALVTGAFAGLFLSGLALYLVGNVARCGNPFGSAGLRQVLRSDLNARQLVIHAARLPLVLFELPWVPAPVRERLETLGERVATSLGATQMISYEESDWFWPGKFHFNLPSTAKNYSLGGLLWLPALGCALLLVLRGFRTIGRDFRKSGLFISAVVAFSSLLPVVFGVRWMAGSGVPIRFLVAPWALGAVLLADLASTFTSGSRSIAFVAGLLVSFQTVPSIHADTRSLWAAIQVPIAEATLDEPFADVLQKLPPGSRVLLFAHQGTRDYPLFRPREGFPNRVITWGKETPTLESIMREVRGSHATHVLFENDEWLSRHWDPSLRVAEAVSALAESPGYQDVKVPTPHMRLFQVIPRHRKVGAQPPEGDSLQPWN